MYSHLLASDGLAIGRGLVGETVGRYSILESRREFHCGRSADAVRCGVLTVAVFVITLGKACVRSTYGLIRTAPAGSGRQRSLRTVSTETHNPAPAESLAKTSFEG